MSVSNWSFVYKGSTINPRPLGSTREEVAPVRLGVWKSQKGPTKTHQQRGTTIGIRVHPLVPEVGTVRLRFGSDQGPEESLCGVIRTDPTGNYCWWPGNGTPQQNECHVRPVFTFTRDFSRGDPFGLGLTSRGSLYWDPSS